MSHVILTILYFIALFRVGSGSGPEVAAGFVAGTLVTLALLGVNRFWNS